MRTWSSPSGDASRREHTDGGGGENDRAAAWIMILSIQLDSTQVVQHLTNASVTYDLNSTTVNPRRHYATISDCG